MKPIIRIGQTYTYQVAVEPKMRAQFEGETVHELYATAAMLVHMEWASRQHLLPALEAGEEGVGYHMNIKHMAPTPIGATVTITSTVTGLVPGRIICHCEARHNGRTVGQATVIQAVLPLANLHARIPSP